MNPLLIPLIILATLVAFSAGLLYWLYAERKRTAAQPAADRFEELVRIFDNKLNGFQQQLEERFRTQQEMLHGTRDHIGKGLQTTADIIGQIQHRLGELEQTSRNVYEVGKDIRSLQDILQAPKQRGVFGELFLDELLSQMLPQDRYKLQFSFKNGERVDAIICLAHGLVPVDAKFPLENFRRYLTTQNETEREQHLRLFSTDTKRHVDAIASKYIAPDEGTLDFALMYIPAENIYYTLLTTDYQIGGTRSIIEYALDKRVIPVSPNTLFAYLQTILLGLRGLKIEEEAKKIQQLLGRLRLDFLKVGEDLGRLGGHLNNAAGSFEKTRKRIERIQGRMEVIDDSPEQPERIAPSELFSDPS